MRAVADARVLVSQGSRVLAHQHVVDAFGHVSHRHPDRPDAFLMSRTLAPALVEASDVLELGLDGSPINPGGQRLFLERFIHAGIYRARPDVMAITHSHSPEVVPFTVVPALRLRPICHVCGFLEDTDVAFDVADHAGPGTDLLIRNAALGDDFARHLGGGSVGLMRAHGFTTVGRSMSEAVFNAIYTVRNCRIHLAANTLGTPTFLTPEESAECARVTSSQADRAWTVWLSEIDEGAALYQR